MSHKIHSVEVPRSATRMDDPAHHAELEFAQYVASLHSEYVEFADAQIAAIERSIEQVRSSIDGLQAHTPTSKRQRKLGAKRIELLRLRGQLEEAKRLRLQANPSLHKYRELYRSILAIPRVARVELKRPRLEIVTDPLYGPDKAGRWHRIGPIKASYDMKNISTSTFYWENLEGPKDSYHAPPNIGINNTSNCMGPLAQEVVKEASSARDHLAVCRLLVRFPECRGNTEVIQMWPVVSEDEVPAWYLETEFEPYAEAPSALLRR